MGFGQAPRGGTASVAGIEVPRSPRDQRVELWRVLNALVQSRQVQKSTAMEPEGPEIHG